MGAHQHETPEQLAVKHGRQRKRDQAAGSGPERQVKASTSFLKKRSKKLLRPGSDQKSETP
jgi:hypothetical protein